MTANMAVAAIIDMSRAAAREPDMIGSGTTMVSAVRQ
jgi:rare lipoprotein A (peptidoglycan hydrolase)